MHELTRFIVLCACLSAAAAAQAQFPDKPVRFILGFGTGGPTDLSVRALAAAASKQLGQPVVVQNMPGAAGALAMAELARQPADGYLVSMITSSYKAFVVHQQKPAFDLAEIHTLLGYVEFRHLFFVRADSPYTSVEELLKFGIANPGAIKFGHVGVGSSLQLQGLSFFRGAGVQVNDVPFKGSAAFTNAVLGGHVDLALIEIAGIRSLARAGTVRLLATVTPQRFADFPDVPTALEKGIEGPELFNPLVGVAVRRGMAPERLKRLHDALRRATEDADFVKSMDEMGLKHGYLAPEAFDSITARAEARALPLMRELGLVKP